MNSTERIFLGLVLLVGLGVILFTLGALGVPIPFLSDGRAEHTETADEVWEDVPPPLLPPEEDEGLLAELENGPGGRFRGLGDPGMVRDGGTPDRDVGPAAGPEGVPEGENKDGAGRDPLIDQLKAKVDPKDAGQLLGFLMAMTTPKGTKLSEEDIEFLFAALGEHDDFGVKNLLLMHMMFLNVSPKFSSKPIHVSSTFKKPKFKLGNPKLN